MLPGKDGIDVCKEIRAESGVPIVMLTAKGDTVDVVVGLESGADDYIVKPFKPKELIARVRARVRRNIGIGLTVPGVALLVLGGVLMGAGVHNTRLAAGAAEIDSGVVAMGVGVLFTIPGAYLWIEGQDSIDTVRWRRQRAVPSE